MIFKIVWCPNETNEGMFLDFLLEIYNVEMVKYCGRGAGVCFKKKGNFKFTFALIKRYDFQNCLVSKRDKFILKI